MIIIDYSGIAISAVVAQKLPPEENLLRHMLLNSIRMYRKKYKNEYGEIVVACDAPNTWRRKVFPYYKAKRREARKKDESGTDWNAVFEIMGKVKDEMAENLPWTVLQIEGAEADDIIGVLAANTQEFGQHEPVMIVSSDKDFIQLQQYKNVAQYSPARKKLLEVDNAKEALRDHILSGDAGDGIPNVLSDDDCFVTEGKRQKPLTKKMRALLETDEGMEKYISNLERNINLIDLSRTPADLKSEIINKFEEQREAVKDNGSKTLNYLIQKQCKLLIEEVGDFIQ